jgi:membrane protein
LKRELSLLVQAVREARQDQAKDLAAAIAFWAFFSIFPLLIGILSLAGYFLESAQLQSRIYEVVSDLLPGSAGLVRDNLEAVVRHRGTMSWVGIGGLFWAGGKGFGAVTRAVNQALGTGQTQSFLLSMARQFFMAVAVSILTITSIAITVVLEIVLEPPFLSRLGLAGVEIPRLQGWIMSFFLVFLVFALIYRLAPYGDVQWRQVLPGALLAAVLFELGKAGFLLYLDRMANFEAVYGPLSSIIVLLLWLYLSALILVFGAEYNIVRWRAGTEAAGTAPGGPE